MPISGVVIKCKEGWSDRLAQTLHRPDEVELHGTLPDGSLVAVIEADSVEGETEIFSRLLETEGVMEVQLAYHNFEDLHEGN